MTWEKSNKKEMQSQFDTFDREEKLSQKSVRISVDEMKIVEIDTSKFVGYLAGGVSKLQAEQMLMKLGYNSFLIRTSNTGITSRLIAEKYLKEFQILGPSSYNLGKKKLNFFFFFLKEICSYVNIREIRASFRSYQLLNPIWGTPYLDPKTQELTRL